MKIFSCISILLIVSCNLVAQSVEEKIDLIISKMTLQEKILQLHQEGSFNTADNTRLNIPGFIMADGPHGLRDGNATAFPVGISMAATWDPDIIYQVGVAMAEEFLAKGKNQILGPCLDLTKDPRNGRSAESAGEDPVLCAYITTSLIKGAQSLGAVTTAKHFNLDSQQNGRFNNNYTISRRNLMEHYGLSYRSAIQEGGVFSIMNAYNLINGLKSAENSELLTDILRTNWGYPFYVVSDWNSIWNVKNAVIAGCNIEMGSTLYERDLYNLVLNNEVPEYIIDDAVKKVLLTKYASGIMNYYPGVNSDVLNSEEHKNLAYLTALKSMILLKNTDNILPLDKAKITKLALIGPSADVAQLDGGGSAYVTPFYKISPKQGIESEIGSAKVVYAKGCDINSSSTTGYTEALAIAKDADVVVFVGGLDDSQEGEGYDRVSGSVMLPGKQQDLINKLAEQNPNLIVVLKSGGIVSISNSINNIKGLLYAFYPGQEGGNAIADVLFGNYNPGGKLPVSMPIGDYQMPARNFDFNDDHLAGYRWYDKLNYVPQFAFGYGLSYSQFTYSNLVITPDNAPLGDRIQVKVDVTNVSSRVGEEVVQLYLIDEVSSFVMPKKELKDFKRISLNPGETKTVKFDLTSDKLYFFNPNSNVYEVESGRFNIKVGGSSDNLPLTGSFTLNSSLAKPDLAIGWVKTIPAFPIKGDTIQFLAGINNKGLAEQNSNFKIDFKINGSVISSATSSDPIKTGGLSMVSSSMSEPYIAVNSGNIIVEAVVDVNNNVNEHLEDNNILVHNLKIYNTPPSNLAFKKPVTYSSSENSSLRGENAVDGLKSTRWSSSFSDPQYITVDLGSIQKFNRVVLWWEAAFGKSYYVQTSKDGASWNILHSTTSGDGGVDFIDKSAEARYVKVLGIQRGSAFGYSLFEIEVFNYENGLNVEEEPKPVIEYKLSNNYPNPFNPSTNISYSLPYDSKINLSVFDILGRKVTTLIDDEKAAGNHSFVFTAANLSSGVYIYKLEAVSSTGKRYVDSKKMILVK